MHAIIPLILLMLPNQSTTELSGGVVSQDHKPVKNAAIWLLGGTKKAEPLKDALIDQRGKSFEPHVLIIPRGSSVNFPNSDTILHNVYAQFEAKRFDLGLYPKGQSKSQVFDKPGVVSVRCNIHSQMSAYIVVVETPHYAVTDEKGHFRISGIPPGTYQLHLWHESGRHDERSLVVKPGGSTMELTLPQR
jgi:plastocyanin